MSTPAAPTGFDVVATLRAAVPEVRGGRVVQTGFLEEADAARLLAAARHEGLAADAWGGRPAALRRIVTFRPDEVPQATAALQALYLPGVHDEWEARARARRTFGLAAEAIGDAVPHRAGVSLIVSGDPDAALLREASADASGEAPAVVPLAAVVGGSVKERSLIVPSLRADALGAKGFGASRSWFAKGIAAQRVRVDGVPAGKATALELGSELFADGLGRLTLTAVMGETKRGNRKVTVRVEKP